MEAVIISHAKPEYWALLIQANHLQVLLKSGWQDTAARGTWIKDAH